MSAPKVETMPVPQLPANTPTPPIIGQGPGTKPGAKPQTSPSWVTSGKAISPTTASGNIGGKALTGQ